VGGDPCKGTYARACLWMRIDEDTAANVDSSYLKGKLNNKAFGREQSACSGDYILWRLPGRGSRVAVTVSPL